MSHSKKFAVQIALILAASTMGLGPLHADDKSEADENSDADAGTDATTETQADTDKKKSKAAYWLRDDEDNWVDFSRFLALDIAFMPVPIIITEPALGFGGGAALMYFWDKRRLDDNKTSSDTTTPDDKDSKEKRTGPPNVTGVAGAVTTNNTWFTAGFHSGSWLNDTLRYMGAAGYTDAKIAFYGSENREWALATNGLDFNLKSFFTVHNLIVRLFNSNLFLGAHYRFMNVNAAFKVELPSELMLEPEKDNRDSGLGPTALWDNRDTHMTPTRGFYAAFRTLFFNEALGGSTNFVKYELRTTFHWPWITNRLFFGFRFDAAFSHGDIPFYQRPFLEMRGMPAVRYQGHHTMLAETELRWRFYKRFSVLGFFGLGQAVEEFEDFGGAETRLAGGVGLRYLLVRALGMHAGVDVARGPEDWAFYLIVGSAWAR